MKTSGRDISARVTLSALAKPVLNVVKELFDTRFFGFASSE